jgi:cytochrome oxidase Cu insertion factor (SCO1/SenC/PrrC family)
MTTTETEISSRSRNRSRASLLLVVVLFLTPVLLAWLLFYVFPDWMPSTTTNHGVLVDPVQPLPAFRLGTLAGEEIDQTWLRGKWTFINIAKGDCGQVCVQQLYKIRQIRLTQGKNIDRLQRLMLWQATGVTDGQRADLQQHFPGQTILPVRADEIRELLDVFRLDGDSAFDSRRIYLIDPLGNLMMYYEPEAEPRGIVKDLERLLKYSGLG